MRDALLTYAQQILFNPCPCCSGECCPNLDKAAVGAGNKRCPLATMVNKKFAPRAWMEDREKGLCLEDEQKTKNGSKVGGHFVYLIRRTRAFATDAELKNLLGTHEEVLVKRLLDSVPPYEPDSERYQLFRKDMEELRLIIQKAASLEVAQPKRRLKRKEPDYGEIDICRLPPQSSVVTEQLRESGEVDGELIDGKYVAAAVKDAQVRAFTLPHPAPPCLKPNQTTPHHTTPHHTPLPIPRLLLPRLLLYP